MEPNRKIFEAARLSRDPRFDGKFFTAVKTTRIYCRTVCPAPSPKEANVIYFATAAAAAEAGFRPCLRCRPESSPGTPAWSGTSATVSRALRLIESGAMDEAGVEELATRLGVGSRHLRRLFLEHLGAAPVAIAQTRRLHFAKKLIDETALPFTEIALASGFGSIRRFNAVFQKLYNRTPGELRRLTQRKPLPADAYRFRLPFRPPYDWDAMLGFLEARAIPGIEEVRDGVYRRSVRVDGKTGDLQVSMGRGVLDVEIRFPESRSLMSLLVRVRRLFDLGADPAVIDEQLGRDPVLKALVRRRPGLRVPGAFDEFELAVRAILGQQISVKAASTMAGRLVSRFGGIHPDLLRDAPLEEAGLIAARAEAIRELARQGMDRMADIRGIGPWTLEYFRMRASGEPDAFPAGDLILQRAAGAASARELEQKSESWRPWRAYAAIHLWQGVKDNASIHDHREPRRAAVAVR